MLQPDFLVPSQPPTELRQPIQARTGFRLILGLIGFRGIGDSGLEFRV